MRIPVVLSLLAVLAGCAVVPPQAWNFDPTQPRPKATLPAEQTAAMTDRVDRLQLERNAIRTRIANEPDVRERLRLYEALHRVGLEFSSLQPWREALDWTRAQLR